MATYHPDAAAIDRVGRKVIMDHFGVSHQAITYWRKTGVPKPHRKTLALLGAVAGVAMPEMNEPRERKNDLAGRVSD